MNPMNPIAQRHHALDSLRFFAAFVVLIAHAIEILGLPPLQLHWFLHGLLDSKAAVCFFFVLSGFVLHCSLIRTGFSATSCRAFVIRRLFRIYPLYYFSLLICLLAATYVNNGPPLASTDYAQRVLDANHSDLQQWLHHALLITPQIDMYFLNPPTWTLSVEMRIALIFPALSFAFSRLSLSVGAALLAMIYPFFWYVGIHTFGTIELIPLFAVGAFAAQHQSRLRLPKGRLLTPCLFMLALVAYGAPAHASLTSIHATLGYFVSSVGACLIMLAALQSPAVKSMLEIRPLIHLGNISYGIYILHYAILLATASLLQRNWLGDRVTAAAVAMLLTILAASACYKMIEKPFIRVGAKLTRQPISRAP